jgi:hypothetical protein
MTESWLAALRQRLPGHAGLLEAVELLRSAAAGARSRIGSSDIESPMAGWVSERLQAYA